MISKFKSCFIFLLLFLVSCSPNLKLVDPPSGRTLGSFQAKAKQAMVVTANKEATDIGVSVLRKGGSAVDAAIAVSFALSVLRPQSSGIGGGGFMLYFDKKKNKTVALDFREFAPFKASRTMYIKEGKADSKLAKDGALSVAVPRLVAGLGDTYDHYSDKKIPWPDLVKPSIDLARAGFSVYPHLAHSILERKDVLSRFNASKKLFLPNSKPLKEGDILVQSDLAGTLEKIAAKGWGGFYAGDVATAIVRSVQLAGGLITIDDLMAVEPIETEPLEQTYQGYIVVTMPPPSSGGVTLIETLNMLEEFPISRWGPYHPKTIHVMTEALRRSFIDRARYLGDPHFVKIPLKGLIAKNYAKTLAESIDIHRATPTESLSPKELTPKESESTTHFSIIDVQGNAVVSTQTINQYFGSGMVVEGTGIVLNDEMDDFSMVGSDANAIEPGKKPLSSMAPTLVFNKKGELVMALGSPGGPRIITAVLQTLLNRIDFEASPLDAVAAKRIHHQAFPDELQYEAGMLNAEVSQKLGAMGHALKELNPPWLVMLISKVRNNWVGVSDPRGTGTAKGF
ncbi:MAG: gamma-glutamyltransferase [Deltaproteobacteria bacterium]|nr:gamma-glutamyltransferase [Deltaproteobacteria bacterium]